MAIQHTGKTPDYDVVLTDSNGIQLGLMVMDANGKHNPSGIMPQPVERSSLKTSQGNQSYSDLEPPYTVLAQSDASGGRASRTYEDDVTRFFDSCRVNTGRAYKVFLNGRETYGTGVRNANTSLPGSMRLLPLAGSQERLAVKFQAGATYTADKIGIWLAAYGKPSGNLTLRLCANHASGVKPGTVLQSKTITHADLNTASLSEFYLFDHTNQALTSGTYYWIEVYADTSDVAAGTYWKVGVSDTPSVTYQSADDGTNWSLSAYSLYYRVIDTTSTLGGHFFQYLRAQYFVTQPSDGSVSKVYKNGRHGVAASNVGNLDKLIGNGSPGWTTNQFAGCVVLLLEGPGSGEAQPWRYVVSNTSSQLVVDTPWLVAHTTSTVFIILGDHVWSEVTGLNLSTTVTDIAVTEKDVVYMAQGDGAPIQKFREYNNSGTWTTGMADLYNTASPSVTVKAVFLETYYSGDQQKLVRTTADTKAEGANVPNTYSATIGFSDTNLKKVGSAWERITGLVQYVDANAAQTVWIMKETGPWKLSDAGIVNVSRDEMKTIASEVMGRVAAKSDVYLYFSVMDTLWRFYDPTFDDVGLMLDEGMPANRSGVVSGILAYPGRTLVCYDAGTSGYSTVMENNGGRGWHEVYRAPKGERITAMDFQTIPGTVSDRLWVRQGADFVAVPFPSNTFDPLRDSNYPFTHEGMIQIASMYAGLIDAWKYWKKIKLQLENVAAGSVWVEVDYSLDNGDWVTMPEAFDAMPLDEQEFITTDDDGREFGVSSKKFDLRLRLLTVDSATSPVVTAAIVNAVTVTEPKYMYTFGTVLEDKNLNGRVDAALTAEQKTALVSLGVADDVAGIGESLTPAQKVLLLRAWSGRAQSLWMNATVPLFDGIAVFLAPPPFRNLTISEYEGEYSYSANITLQEA